jgi:hypothetical protein
LATNSENNFRVAVDIVIEIGVTNFGDFALAACTAPRAAILGLFEEAHLAEKIAGV